MNKLNICGTNFTMKRVSDLHTDNGALDGQITYDDSIICINSKIKDTDRVAEVLMHEVIHGIDQSLHIGLSEDNVQRMANGLHQMGLGHILLERVNGRTKKNSS